MILVECYRCKTIFEPCCSEIHDGDIMGIGYVKGISEHGWVRELCYFFAHINTECHALTAIKTTRVSEKPLFIKKRLNDSGLGLGLIIAYWKNCGHWEK